MITKNFAEVTTQEYIEATKDVKKYIGKRCRFWNENNLVSIVGILLTIDETRKDKFKMAYEGKTFWYDVRVPEEIIL